MQEVTVVWAFLNAQDWQCGRGRKGEKGPQVAEPHKQRYGGNKVQDVLDKQQVVTFSRK